MAITENVHAPLQPVRIGLAGAESRLGPVAEALEGAALRRGLALRLRRFQVSDPRRPGAVAELIARARAAGFDTLHCTAPLLGELSEMIHDSVLDGDRARLYDTIFLSARHPLQGCDAGTWALHSALGSFLDGRPADHVLILGTGAEGQSAAIALAARGVRRLTFHDPDMSRAASLANLMQDCTDMRCTLLASTEGLFHARSTPGMTQGWIDGIVHAPGSNMPPQQISDLAPPLWLVDMAAYGTSSALSGQARAAGCAVLEGAEIARRRGARLLDCSAERSHEGCGLGWLHLDPTTSARGAARRSG